MPSSMASGKKHSTMSVADKLNTTQEAPIAQETGGLYEDETASKPGAPEETCAPQDVEPSKKSRWRLIGLVSLAALALIGLAVIMVVSTPPVLVADEVLSDFDSSELVSLQLVDPSYTKADEYRVEGEQVTGIDDVSSREKLVHMEFALANSAFSLVVSVDRNYQLVDRVWQAGEWSVKSIEATPIAPVDEVALLNAMPELFTAAPTDNPLSLAQIYDSGNFELLDNTLDGSRCTTTVRMQKAYTLTSFEGTLHASFVFEPSSLETAGGWRLASVSVDEGAYDPHTANLIGQWIGRLEETSSSSVLVNPGSCFAAQEQPLGLRVTSFDLTTGELQCNVSFIVHNHDGLTENAKQSSGDTMVSLEEIVITLDAQSLEGSWVPETLDVDQGAYRLEFINEDGVWKLRVVSGPVATDAPFSLGSATFEDVYVLERL